MKYSKNENQFTDFNRNILAYTLERNNAMNDREDRQAEKDNYITEKILTKAIASLSLVTHAFYRVYQRKLLYLKRKL